VSKPRLLDLFCGAGGAAKGYQRASFYVVGVDIKPQPHYCGDDFILGDALDVLARLLRSEAVQARSGRWYRLSDFDAIHASPPCQGYANVTRWRGNQGNHERLIEPVRELLEATGLPFVIENVRTTKLRHPIMLCGSMFDLRVRRHRYFESRDQILPMNFSACDHIFASIPFEHKQEREYALKMGIDWMTNRESREAIPPAYTEWIGRQLLAHLEVAS
jgi:DNA (cytosine-5)-methyltransferase 1